MSSLPSVPDRLLNGHCVFNISILRDCVAALALWNVTSGPINSKFITLMADLAAAESPPVGTVNPYALDGKIKVLMSLMYRTKDAFATWEYENNGLQNPRYLNTKATVYSLIDQYEMGMYSPSPRLPIIV